METMTMSGGSAADAFAFGGLMFLVLTLLSLAVGAVFVLCSCLIFRKAGWHWTMGLLALMPALGGLIVILILAFVEWPVQRQLRAAQMGGAGGPRV